jgi:hypothetical protein
MILSPEMKSVAFVGRRFRLIARLDAPVAPLVPVIAEHFCRMLCAAGTVSALQRFHRAIFVASPACALGMLRVQGEFLCHLGRFECAHAYKPGLITTFTVRLTIVEYFNQSILRLFDLAHEIGDALGCPAMRRAISYTEALIEALPSPLSGACHGKHSG